MGVNAVFDNTVSKDQRVFNNAVSKDQRVFDNTYQLIREIVLKIGFKCKELPINLEDLIQDVTLILLEHPPTDVKPEQLRYYITRIVLNHINSSTSPYYYKYKKLSNMSVDYEDVFRN